MNRYGFTPLFFQFSVIEELSAMGADGFILGTSALFGKGRPYAEIIPELRGEKA